MTYDRVGSSISRRGDSHFEWDAILQGARVFHTTGITPALSDHMADQTRGALEAARRQGALVSYDLNYRARLWGEDKARAVQEPLMGLVDVLITTEEDTRRVFGIEGANYDEVAKKLAERFGFKIVTITLRGDRSVLRNDWTAIAYAGGDVTRDRSYEIEIVDRVGGGDAYAAGFICGLLNDGVGEGVRYGNAFSALKQTTWSDFCWATRDEVDALLAGSSSRILGRKRTVTVGVFQCQLTTQNPLLKAGSLRSSASIPRPISWLWLRLSQRVVSGRSSSP